jgi:hypothetical protein
MNSVFKAKKQILNKMVVESFLEAFNYKVEKNYEN